MGYGSTLARLQEQHLVVVARRLAFEHAAPVAEVLAAAGVPALEITLDEPSAVSTIADLHRRFGDMLLVGAGTALRPADAGRAMEAGADFVVSPIFVPAILRLCVDAGVLYIPGAQTPSEIFAALDAGARAVKLFPASAVTPSVVRDVREPFRSLDPIFMITGGLDSGRIPAYIAAGVAIVGVGGAILAHDDLEAHQYARIGVRAEQVLSALHAVAP